MGQPALLPSALEKASMFGKAGPASSRRPTRRRISRWLTQAFEESVAEMQEGGFLPPSPVPAEPRMLPLTEPQREVWLAAQRGADASCALIESLSVHLEGDFHLEAMQSAVQQVVDRHEALRTTFPANGDCQWIHPTLTLAVPLHDFSAVDGAAAFSMLVTAEGQTPFDLIHGPLFRACIVRRGPQRHILVLTAHHLVCDGWSFGILLGEIGSLYAAGLKGEAVQLPPVNPFHLYARQQSSATAAISASEAYWKARLSGDVPSLELPTDRARAAAQTFRGGRGVAALTRPWSPTSRVSGHEKAPRLLRSCFPGLPPCSSVCRARTMLSSGCRRRDSHAWKTPVSSATASASFLCGRMQGTPPRFGTSCGMPNPLSLTPTITRTAPWAVFSRRCRSRVSRDGLRWWR